MGTEKQKRKQSKVATIRLKDIRENPAALRTVNTENEKFLGLRDSIIQSGLLNPISVREKTEKDESGTTITFFEICDGLHRYTACIAANLKEIPVLIVDLSDDQSLEAQIMANFHRVETKPIEFTRGIQRILIRNPLLTVNELATNLGVSSGFINDRLGLMKIDNEKIKELINTDKICLSNAYALAHLPEEEMPDWADRAMTLPSKEFCPAVQKRVTEINKAKREGRKANPITFSPTAFLQKMSVIKDEMENHKVRKVLLAKYKVTTPADAFDLAVCFCVNMDKDSINTQEEAYNLRKKVREDAAATTKAKTTKAEEIKARKKLEEAATAANAAQASAQNAKATV